MKGKAKCKILREIRQKIAEENDIELITKDCTYQGECKGTCPKCEAEVRYLEQELEKRRSLGKAVTVAALAASLTVGLTGCVPQPLAGAVERETTECTDLETETAEPVKGELLVTETMGEPPEQTETEDLWMGAVPRASELTGDVAYLPETTDVP